MIPAILLLSARLLLNVSLTASDWTLLNGNHPTQLNGMIGWYVDVPSYPDSLNYVTTPFHLLDGKSSISFTVQIDGLGTIGYQLLDSSNTCNNAPTVRLYFQVGNKLTNNEFTRWWSNPIAIQLINGTYTATTPLTYNQWSDIYGQTDSIEFQNALQHVSRIGMTFGGGCFFGHGVYSENGPVRFILLDYKVQ